MNGERPPPDRPADRPDVDPRHHRNGVPSSRSRGNRYIVLNKPLGVITTAKDESSRSTVLDVVGDEGKAGHRLFPGRPSRR